MVDGFRFDLMGLIDKETMLQAKKILQEFDPDVILYGNLGLEDALFWIRIICLIF